MPGFLGSTIAVVVRNLILARGAGLGPDDSKTPVLVIVYAAIASLGAGSLALEVAEHSGLGGAPVLIGTMAGLFASILLAMLMVTYHTNPGEAPETTALADQRGQAGSTLSPACSISARSSDTSLLAVVSSLSP